MPTLIGFSAAPLHLTLFQNSKIIRSGSESNTPMWYFSNIIYDCFTGILHFFPGIFFHQPNTM